MSFNDFFRLKSTKTSFLAKTQFYLQKVTKATFLGQIRPKQVFPANIDQNYIVQAENRKMKTAKLRPKKDKNTPFSSVLISSPGRIRVTELGSFRSQSVYTID